MPTVPLIIVSTGLALTPASAPTPPIPPSPPAPPAAPASPEAIKSSAVTVTIVRDGKETTITRTDGEIRVIYPGPDGERIEVRAVDEAELRRSPEAYELYQKYLGRDDGRVRAFWTPDGRELGIWRFTPRMMRNGPRIEVDIDPDWADNLRRLTDQSVRNAERARERAMEQAERARERLDQLRERSAQQPFASDPANPARQLGLQIDRADTALRAQLGDGVLITRVVPNSRAERMGLRTWDFIKRFGTTDLTEPDQLRELIRSADGPVTLEVIRGGKPLTLTETVSAATEGR